MQVQDCQESSSSHKELQHATWLQHGEGELTGCGAAVGTVTSEGQRPHCAWPPPSH